MKKCVVFAGGPIRDYASIARRLARDAFVACADSGLRHAAELGLAVDLAVGDFDSHTGPIDAKEIIRLPREKDDTDTLAALRECLRRGFKAFELYGATGGRLDHLAANFSCLRFLAARGARGWLLDERNAATVMEAGCIELKREDYDYFSVFPFDSVARGVDIAGAKYPLRCAELRSDFPLGVSNEFTGDTVTVSVREGALLIILTREGGRITYDIVN